MIRCWCGNESLKEYSKDYYCCEKCHTLISKTAFLDTVYDVEDEDNDLYGKNYWEVSMTKAAGKSTLSEVVDMYLTERVIYWLKYILKYVRLGADVAEVGCGLGQLQYVLSRLGYIQLAFELSADICTYMEQKLGIHAHCGAFTAKKEGYDAILAFDLFEHLLEPLEFVQQSFDSLKKNGVLCLQTPCYDFQLSHEEMREKKGKFEEQLKAEQHIYLYSREAITGILQKHGFRYIVFEPAFFGDDYDMFLFASKEPLQTNTEQEIDEYLNAVPSGRLVKAMIKLFDEKIEFKSRYQDADNDRRIRLEQNKKLEQLLQESEADRASRLEQINELAGMLQESEKDRASRLEQINELKRMLQESKADRASGLEQTNELTRMLQESEADRASRLEQINELQRMLQESEVDRASGLDQISELTSMLQESEADRAARMDQINELKKMLQESEADRAARMDQINELTRLLQGSEVDRAARLEQINELTKMVNDATEKQ